MSSAVVESPPLPLRHRRDVDSFYHLSGCLLAGRACRGTACFVARHLHPERWAKAERQQPPVYCLGQCFEAPAVAGPSAPPLRESPSEPSIVLRRLIQGGARSLTDYRRLDGYRAWEKAQRQSPDDVIKTISVSELRGRGGAGFPVGRKWRSAADQPPGEKFIIANADEGDAGAYLDRFLLEEDPHAVIEGMLIAAYAVGASRGWIYLRSEYPAAKSILQTALAEARVAGLLGKDARGTGRPFEIDVHVGGGSYVCGEETALMRSLEGRRPEVTARPPHATERGVFGRPTVMNNVETLVNVPWIVEHGGDSYRGFGFSKSRGKKVVSLNSLFQRPGLYEVEFGVSIRHLVEELGGGLLDGAPVKGVMLGGPLAGIIPPHLFDTPLGFEELQAIGAGVGHGGVIAFDHRTRLPALLHHVFAFAADESCGKCTPCRLGSRRVEQRLATSLLPGVSEPGNRRDCEKIIAALHWTSLCGLGTGLAEFAESVLRHYGKELEPCLR